MRELSATRVNIFGHGLYRLFLRDGEQILPLYTSRVSAGFPSPAEDYLHDEIDLNAYLINNPTATFLVRVKGDSMVDAHILDGDLLVVDRSLKARHGDVIVGFLAGEFTVKRLDESDQKGPRLVAANTRYPDIAITEEMGFRVWGVVVNVIHKMRRA